MKYIVFCFFLGSVVSMPGLSFGGNGDCEGSEKGLISMLGNLCESFSEYDLEEDFVEKKEEADSLRMKYLKCGREGFYGNEEKYLDVFMKSKYVLSEINFYLKVKEERAEGDPEYWETEEGLLSHKVEEECGVFFEAISE